MEKQHNEAVVVAYGRSAVAKSGKKGALRQMHPVKITDANGRARKAFPVKRLYHLPSPQKLLTSFKQFFPSITTISDTERNFPDSE